MDCCIEYITNIGKNGSSFFYSPAYQLAERIKGDFESYRVSFDLTWLGAEIFVEQILRKQTWFTSEVTSGKIKSAYIDYDIDTDRMTYFVSENIEQSKEFFKLDYAIVKCLRDTDLIRLKTIERDVRHKAYIHYSITKENLKKADYKIEQGSFGDVVVVPAGAFKRVVGSLVKQAAKKARKK